MVAIICSTAPLARGAFHIPTENDDMKIFTFAASLRQASLNQKLIDRAAILLREAGAEVTEVPFAAIAELPPYSQDTQDESGIPAASEYLKDLLESHDGFVIAVPEYNYSIPGSLKNAIDWASRFRPQPWRGTRTLLLSASPSLVGGSRGLWMTRVPFEGLGVRVFPDMFSLARAGSAFSEDGAIIDEGLEARLRTNIQEFLDEF